MNLVDSMLGEEFVVTIRRSESGGFARVRWGKRSRVCFLDTRTGTPLYERGIFLRPGERWKIRITGKSPRGNVWFFRPVEKVSDG